MTATPPGGSEATPAPGAGGAIDVDPSVAARLRGVGRSSPTWRRALALLWVGQVVSHFGDSLYQVGIFFLALRVTGSKAQSGLLLALSFVPALFFGLFAGTFVDRHDRRRVLLISDVVRTLAVAAIPLLDAADALTPVTLGAAMLTLATGSAFFNPAIKAIIPELAPPGRLVRAATLIQLSEYAALGLGPAIAGLIIIPELGAIHLFTIDAGTFVVSTLCVLALAPIARRTAHTPPPVRLLRLPRGVGIWRETREGLRMVLADGTVRALILFVAIDNLLLAGLYQVATPLHVKEHLGLDNDAYARAQSCFFFGMLFASAALWAFAGRLRKGVAILCGIVLDGLTFVPLALCRTLPEVGAALFVHALAVPLIIIPRTVLVQQLVPGPLHGRAFALVNVTVFGMTALSAGLTGALSEWFDPRQLFLGLGLAGALIGLLGFATRLRTAR